MQLPAMGGCKMNAGFRYMETVSKLIELVRTKEQTAIRNAAEAVAVAVKNGRTWHVFGTGHSHIIAEELFYRAGGFAGVNPILVENLMLHGSATHSTQTERMEGLAAAIMEQQPVQAGDVLLIASNSGRNAVTIEMAEQAKLRGMTVIAITSMKQAASSTSRHASGKLLHELSDVIIDNHGEIGDAAVKIEGLDVKVSPTSTVVGAMIANAIAAEAMELLVREGIEVDVFSSSNTDAGELRNQALIEKYKGVIRCL